MKDKSLEEINLLKLIVFTLSFISICTALILFLLLPALKKYQQISLVEHSQLSILKTTQSNFDFSKDKITKLKNENPKSLEQFKQNLILIILIFSYKNTFKILKFKKINQKKENI